MNRTSKAVTTAMLFALGSGTAFAASNAGWPTSGGQVDPGDLVFAYEAADGQSSVVWDLSNGADDLTWGSILASGPFTINNATVTEFVVANPGGRWNILALTNTKIGGVGFNLQYDQAGFALTINGAPNFDAPNGNTGGKIEALAKNNAAWIAAANAGGLPDNGALLAGPADPWQFNAGGTHSNFIADQNATGVVGDTLALWTILIDNTAVRGLATNPAGALNLAPVFAPVTSPQGAPMAFTFAANGDLSYSPVPVPAAVWLMGSAIAGLGIVRRRRA